MDNNNNNRQIKRASTSHQPIAVKRRRLPTSSSPSSHQSPTPSQQTASSHHPTSSQAHQPQQEQPMPEQPQQQELQPQQPQPDYAMDEIQAVEEIQPREAAQAVREAQALLSPDLYCHSVLDSPVPSPVTDLASSPSPSPPPVQETPAVHPAISPITDSTSSPPITAAPSSSNPSLQHAIMISVLQSPRRVHPQLMSGMNMLSSLRFVPGDMTAVTVLGRELVVEYMTKVAEQLRVPAHSLAVAVSYLNRLLTSCKYGRPQLNLVSLVCIMLASKMEDIDAPTLSDIAHVYAHDIGPRDVVNMELSVIKELTYDLTTFTPYSLLPLILKSMSRKVIETEKDALALRDLASFAAHLCMLNLELSCVQPGIQAYACVLVALYVHGEAAADLDYRGYCEVPAHVNWRKVHKAFVDIVKAWTPIRMRHAESEIPNDESRARVSHVMMKHSKSRRKFEKVLFWGHQTVNREGVERLASKWASTVLRLE